jgi:hypothetical protein
MTISGQNTSVVRPLERFLAMVGGLACVVMTAVIWRSVSAFQGTWPLPGLYFLEMAAMGIVGAIAFVRRGPYGAAITWAIAGIFAAFSVVGAWSVGFLYLPITLIFGIVSLSYDVRNRQPLIAHVGVCLIAAIAQAALMFAVVGLL